MEYSIKKYNDWKSNWAKSSQIGIMDYISFNVHPEDVLILSWLFLPKLIEVDECIFLEVNYSEKNYSLWKAELNNNKQAIERMMNHVHVYDIFANCSDDVDSSVFEKVGKLLQTSWSSHFNHEYPGKEVVVECTNDDRDYGPVLYIYQK